MITLSTILLLCLAAFAAGFVDAVVGGGGLLQVPAGLILLPHLPVATVLGTLKIPALTGTSIAATHYIKRVPIRVPYLLLLCLLAFSTSVLGTFVLSHIDNQFLKPIILFVLTVVMVFTFLNKKLGLHAQAEPAGKKHILSILLATAAIGFYDGFIGPGTGSFLVMSYILILGLDFLHASVAAKLVNVATNLATVLFFTIKGTIIWPVAIPMAACNALGGFLGARTAISKGNKFIRVFFLVVVAATLMRLAWDVFGTR